MGNRCIQCLNKRLYRRICGAVRIMVPFVQFEKREKYSWRSVNFSRVAGWSLHFSKINTPPWVFFTFFRLYKWYQNVPHLAIKVVFSSKSSIIDVWQDCNKITAIPLIFQRKIYCLLQRRGQDPSLQITMISSSYACCPWNNFFHVTINLKFSTVTANSF